MAFGKINNLELDSPSSFSEENEVIGGYNTTLGGTRKRYIKAVKKVWKLGYSMLTSAKYDLLYAEFAKEIPVGLQESDSYSVFTVYDARFGVNAQNVHMDISSRELIPGTDIISSVEITLTQL